MFFRCNPRESAQSAKIVIPIFSFRLSVVWSFCLHFLRISKMKRSIAFTLIPIFAAACTTSSDKPAYSADTTTTAPTAVVPPAAPEVPPAPVDSGSTSQQDWTVTSAGIGSLKAGMTIAEMKAAAPDLVVPAKLQECDYVRVTSAPKGVGFMVESERLSRVDVRNNTSVKTASGAGIGDTEDRIKSLYPGQVTVQPHKYTDGHYLVVKPSNAPSGDLRIVFETNGKNVTEFRSGKTPAVEYVEGCS